MSRDVTFAELFILHSKSMRDSNKTTDVTKQVEFESPMSYPHFVWGLLFVHFLILVSQLMVLNVSYSVKQMTIPCF